MLSKSARLTESSDFARTTKSGHRVATEFFVGYLYLTGTNESPKAGLIISKSVGGSVLRHRIARKARHAIAQNLLRDIQQIRGINARTKRHHHLRHRRQDVDQMPLFFNRCQGPMHGRG